MKTLDEVIALAEKQEEYFGWVRDSELQDKWDAILHYLKELRNIRGILPDRLIGYFGRTPVVQIDGFYFGVREYDKLRGGWRCERVEESSITHDWVCTDDDTYIIDNSGKVLYRLVGWDLRREEYRREDVGK